MTGPGFANVLGGDNGLDAQQTVEHYTKVLSEIYFQRSEADGDDVDARLLTFIGEIFDIERFAPQLLQKRWQKLNGYEQAEFKRAIQRSIKKKFVYLIAQSNQVAPPTLVLQSKELKEKFARLNYSFAGEQGTTAVTLFMLKDAEGSWKISNIKGKKESLLRYYYTLCNDLFDDYSFPYLIGELRDEGYIVLEDFESGEVGSLPRRWTWKSKDNNKNKPYEIQSQDGNQYLAANDNGESVILGKKVKWNLKKYPYVSFRWRGRKLPDGGDERFGKSVDSAAGIYFIYRKKIGLIPESVKYVWSTTLPIGSAMRRSGTGRPWMVVAESGAANLGQWHTYVFNLYEAYRKTFGGDPPDKPIGIGILSDANSTKSMAYADYDDIRALRNAEADSGVKEHLEAE